MTSDVTAPDRARPVGTPPRSWAARSLDWALRIVDEGPGPFYRAAIVSLALTCAASAAVAEIVRPHAALPQSQRHMIEAALLVLGLSAALGLASLATASRFRATWLDRVLASRERAAIWLAFAIWFPFLLLIVYYRAKATFPPPVKYVYFPFDDKRYDTAEYLLGVLAPVLLLVTSARVLAVGRGHPPTWRAWFTGLFPRSAAAHPGPRSGRHAAGAASVLAGRWRSSARRLLPVAAGLVTALGLAWYFAGPPWYLSQNAAPISHQEEVVLIGLQAVAKGHLPYVGVASVQYGPGTQVAAYLLMHHVTSFSVVGFRQAWALLLWAGVFLLFAVFFLAFGYFRGLTVSLLSALVYPAFHLLAFQPHGSFDGYFGWYSPLRYVGLIALVLLLPAVVRRSPSWRGVAAGVAIGALWGLMSYLAQENAAGGAVGALLVGALLLFSGSASWRAVRTALVAVLAGFLVIWTPILAVYAVHGQLVEFLQQYFLFPQAVAAGANDTPWGGFKHHPSPYRRMYVVLPFLLAGLTLLTVVQVRPLRIATEWSRQRALLVATVLTTALLYEGALLRSDQAHLSGTLLMIPALVVATATVLPRVSATVLPRLSRPQRGVTAAVAGAALFAASFWLLPHAAFTRNNVRSWAEAPYLDRQQLALGPPAAKPATLAGMRVGAGLDEAPQCCQGAPVSMPRFIHLMEQIHTIVGNRTAYVANFHGEYPGLVYFAADLNPAPVSSDPYSSIETEPELKAFLADFRTRVLPHTQAVLTFNVTTTPEAQYFLRRYPNAERITLHFDRQPYYILLRQG